MSKTVISVENIAKQYRLGVVGSGTLRDDLKRWTARVRGKPDPLAKIGDENDLGGCDSGYVWALKNISFEVKQGEVLGIIGKNGSGKSTLLKILSRVTGPTVGRIRAKGRVAALLEVGTGFHPELTGRENIYLNGAIMGMSRAEVRGKLEEIVEFAGVARYVDTPVKRYSSGMIVRLGFAVAAHLEPEILIVDEVLAVGDAEFQRKCIGKMHDVAGAGRTVLFVSHNMGSVRNLCERVILLRNGQIDRDSSAADSISAYLAQNSRKKRNGKAVASSRGFTLQEAFAESETLSPADTILNGTSVSFCFSYVNTMVDFAEAIPSISILRDDGLQITTHHSRLVGKIYRFLPNSGVFRIRLERVPLPPGRYFVSFSLVVDQICLINAESCIVFDVTSGNFFKSIESVPASHSMFYIDADWSNSEK